ncbi:hypothetical protein ABH932_006732 [Streptacidiphilus sp. MAP5-52]
MALPPRAHSTGTGISVTPISVITTPMTWCGKNRISRPKNGPTSRQKAPAIMTAPRMLGSRWSPWFCSAIASIGPIPAEDAALTNGRRLPTRFFTPSVCSSVAAPATSRLAAIRKVSSRAFRPQAGPTISGGATTPAYMAAMCCNAAGTIRRKESFSSTGWTAS